MLNPVVIESCVPLRNAEYFYFLYNQIALASRRVWASIFTINTNLRDDTNLTVRQILKSLAAAKERSVDVRILLGADEENLSELQVANQVALQFMNSLGIPARNYQSVENSNSHSKYVIIDDHLIILGSHNWSPRAFTAGIDDSIAIYSSPLAAEITPNFLHFWKQANFVKAPPKPLLRHHPASLLSGKSEANLTIPVESRQWLANLGLNQRQQVRANKLLAEISRLVGGAICDDIELSQAEKSEFAWDRVVEVLQSRMIRYRNYIRPVTYDSKANSTPLVGLHSPQFDEFFRNPTFENYVNGFLKNGSSLSSSTKDAKSWQDAAIGELELIYQELENKSQHEKVGALDTLASEVRIQNEIRRKSREIQAIQDARIQGSLVIGRHYLPVIKNVIDHATVSLKMIMYYVRYESRKNYPTQTLFASLEQAHQRGVRIEVILDRDRKTDIYKSSRINRNAFRRLKQMGITIKYDKPEEVTHSKVIIVDEHKVVLGSHNWTANSLLRYDDASILIESPTVAKDYARDFDRRFKALQ